MESLFVVQQTRTEDLFLFALRLFRVLGFKPYRRSSRRKITRFRYENDQIYQISIT